MFEILRLLAIETNRTILTNLDTFKTSSEVFDEVKEKVEIKNREAVYKALEKLKDAGLIEKKYFDEKKKISYKRKYREIRINLNTMEIKLLD